MKRRDFLRGTAHAAAWTAVSAGRVHGANERVRVGPIGCGGRGVLDTRLIRGTPEDIHAVAPDNYHDGKLDPRVAGPRNVEVVALCDVWTKRSDEAKQWAPAARTFGDFRKLLEQKDVDAVVIATQDHWHAAMTILA